MKLIATGLNAFETNARPEGTVKFLATPQQVIELVTAGKTDDFIILVRGGTTTFLSPVLTAGTLGILTMSGAPESHLGILSREFQIPCVLTLAIEGWDRRYAPGLTDPSYFEHIVGLLDGRRVCMDCSDWTHAKVYLDGVGDEGPGG